VVVKFHIALVVYTSRTTRHNEFLITHRDIDQVYIKGARFQARYSAVDVGSALSDMVRGE
jgi:hypothetical protein